MHDGLQTCTVPVWLKKTLQRKSSCLHLSAKAKIYAILVLVLGLGLLHPEPSDVEFATDAGRQSSMDEGQPEEALFSPSERRRKLHLTRTMDMSIWKQLIGYYEQRRY